MNISRITIFILFFFPLTGSAQKIETEQPDYKKIKKVIANKQSDFYYPKLMERFQDGDSTLTLEEKRNLYYGYTFQAEYSPYWRSDYRDSLALVLQMEIHEIKELYNIIEFADSMLVKNPFDLTAINYQYYAYQQLDDVAEANKRVSQMVAIIDALLSSGDGLKKETSFYVINTAHEYDLLQVLGYEFGGRQRLIDHYDYLTLAENSEGIQGLFFDVSPCLNKLRKLF